MLLHLWGQSTNHPGTDDVITELEKIPSHVTAMGFGWGCGELLFLLDKPVYMLEGRLDFPMQLETQVLKVSHATLPRLEDQHHPNTSDKGIVREHVWTSTCLSIAVKSSTNLTLPYEHIYDDGWKRLHYLWLCIRTLWDVFTLKYCLDVHLSEKIMLPVIQI